MLQQVDNTENARESLCLEDSCVFFGAVSLIFSILVMH